MKNRFKLHALCLLHKVKLGDVPPYLSDAFIVCSTVHDHHTRQTQHFYVPPFKTHIRQKTLFISSAREYNNLPDEIKMLTSVLGFKVALKRYLLNNQ